MKQLKNYKCMLMMHALYQKKESLKNLKKLLNKDRKELK